MRFTFSSALFATMWMAPGQSQQDGDDNEAYPVTITNCAVTSTIEAPPQRAVTMNQGTTEIMLALGLTDHMVGTAYLDDEIWPLYKEAYESVPVLSDTYPDIETLLSVDPDFLYGSYSSAFSNSSIDYHSLFDGEPCDLVLEARNGHRAYCRPELHDYGVQTYLQTAFCELVEDRPVNVTVESGLFAELMDIASIFNVPQRANVVMADIELHFNKALEVSSPTATAHDGAPDEPIKVLWLDGWDDSTPYVGACCGSPQLIMEHAGAKNIFETLGEEERRTWENAPWKDVVAADPDVIVLVDASWDPANEKILNLCNHPVTSQLRAVRNRSYISVPFSGSTLGVKIGSLSYNLAEAMVALALKKPLPSLEFSTIAMAYNSEEAETGSQAVTMSGVKVYTTLPSFNGTDLEATCASQAPQVVIVTDKEEEEVGSEEEEEEEDPDDTTDQDAADANDELMAADPPVAEDSSTNDVSANGDSSHGTNYPFIQGQWDFAIVMVLVFASSL